MNRFFVESTVQPLHSLYNQLFILSARFYFPVGFLKSFSGNPSCQHFSAVCVEAPLHLKLTQPPSSCGFIVGFLNTSPGARLAQNKMGSNQALMCTGPQLKLVSEPTLHTAQFRGKKESYPSPSLGNSTEIKSLYTVTPCSFVLSISHRLYRI